MEPVSPVRVEDTSGWSDSEPLCSPSKPRSRLRWWTFRPNPTPRSPLPLATGSRTVTCKVASRTAREAMTRPRPEPDDVRRPATKTEAVRQALLAGISTPVEIAAYIRRMFGFEISSPHISTVKCQIKRDARASKPARRPARKPGRPPTKAIAETPPRDDAEPGLTLDELSALKDLVARVGGVNRLQAYLTGGPGAAVAEGILTSAERRTLRRLIRRVGVDQLQEVVGLMR